MRFSNIFFATAILFGGYFFSLPATADATKQQFEQGLTAIENGDYQTAFKLWKPLAEDNDMSAQFNLGMMYEKGDGVGQDYFEALKWYKKAAEQGHTTA